MDNSQQKQTMANGAGSLAACETTGTSKAVRIAEPVRRLRRSALQSADWCDTESGVSARTVTLAERRGLKLVQLQGPLHDRTFAEEAQRQLGTELPSRPDAVAYGERVTVLALGPSRWLLVAQQQAEFPEGRPLFTAHDSMSCAVTDISHGWTVIRIGGDASRDLLSKLCSIDLHPDSFQEGRCVQTELRGLYIILHAVDSEHFDLWVMRSYANSIWDWLRDGAAEYTCYIRAPIE